MIFGMNIWLMILLTMVIVYVTPEVIIDAILSNIIGVIIILLLARATGLRARDRTGLARYRGKFVSKWETIIINMFWIAALSSLMSLLTLTINPFFLTMAYIEKRITAFTLLIFGSIIYRQ